MKAVSINDPLQPGPPPNTGTSLFGTLNTVYLVSSHHRASEDRLFKATFSLVARRLPDLYRLVERKADFLQALRLVYRQYNQDLCLVVM